MNVSALRQAGGSAFRHAVHESADTGSPSASAQISSSTGDLVPGETMGARAGQGPVGSSWPTQGSAETFSDPEQYCGRASRRAREAGGWTSHALAGHTARAVRRAGAARAARRGAHRTCGATRAEVHGQVVVCPLHE